MKAITKLPSEQCHHNPFQHYYNSMSYTTLDARFASTPGHPQEMFNSQFELYSQHLENVQVTSRFKIL